MKIIAYRKRLTKRWNADTRVKKLRTITKRPSFGRLYLIVSLVVLAGATCVWSFLGAQLHLQNADQLVNAYLFENHATLSGSTFPGQHSFLLKWPLFYLIKMLGFTDNSFTLVTVATVLLSVAAFAWLLYRIEKRPLVFGTICLALASVFLLIPTVPYAGALLPENMAMVTTRNLEYIVYIIALIFLARASRIRSRQFLAAVLLLALLISSDKLFMLLSAGGAVIGIIGYGMLRRWEYVSRAILWFMATIGAALVATIIIAVVNQSGLAHIGNQPNAGPYGISTDAKDILLGALYAVSGFFSNYGANPAFNAVVVKQAPASAFHNLVSLAGPSYLVNLVVLAGVLYGCYRTLLATVTTKKKQQLKANEHVILTISMLLTAFASFGLFIFSKHYYAVDARYLAVGLFAGVIAATTYLSQKKWQPEQLTIVGGVLLLSTVFGIVASIHSYSVNSQSLSVVTARNQTIVQALSSHKVDVLVGDYWRVVPTRQASHGKLAILPLQTCTEFRSVLTSSVWHPDLRHKRFAYLLSSDGSLTDFPRCNLRDILATFGRPNASYLIEGSLSDPKEQLLFYDQGSNHATSHNPATATATVLPITLNQLPNMTCNVPTLMNVVAHQDDDLLFLSPDLLHAIDAKDCVRTIYITAGDAGFSEPYWLGREQGSEAAYSSMLGTKDLWIQRIVSLSPHAYVTIANPKGNPHVSLVFMHLPDGNVHGQGFRNTNFQGLQKLLSGQVGQLNSIDGQSTYSSTDLVDALSQLMAAFRPTEIHTQSSLASGTYGDHSDHISAGQFAERAYLVYEKQQYGDKVTIPLSFYRGYNIHELAPNLEGADLDRKEAAFLAYSQFDGGVCHSHDQCAYSSVYGAYIDRQYQNGY
jgi:LmbE family N-acetylglucosaminyl deacetylase